LLRGAADAIWPPVCPVCGCDLDSVEIACRACIARLSPLDGRRCRVCSDRINGSGDTCGPCAALPEATSARVIACEYERVRPWVIAYKFGHRVVVGPVLARAFADLVWERVRAASPDVVMFVPIHVTRQRERGFNQSELLARELAARLRAGVDDHSLERHRRTLPQARLGSREERAENVRGAFRIGDGAGVEGLRIALVDDVVTTGATAGQCAAALRSAGAKDVFVCALAHPFLAPGGDVDVAEFDL